MRKAGNYHIDNNPNENGIHILHLNGCDHQPKLANQLQLGYHLGYKSAVITGNITHPSIEGCIYCCKSMDFNSESLGKKYESSNPTLGYE